MNHDIEENKKIVKEFYEEIFNNGNIYAVDKLLSKDFIDHSFSHGKDGNIEDVKNAFIDFYRTFSDIYAKIDDMVTEDNKIVVRFTWYGTHMGKFMDIEPTRKRVAVSVIDIFRITNSKITDRWGAEDNLGLLKQLGIKWK